ncbi:MAG: exonuclease SbcCD subunit D [Anaerolineae bacterium]|nr:exonuclease SbcCD subunit D [Anaerolineae bacterium]
MSTRAPIRVLHFADLHLGVEAHGRLDPETGLSQRVRDFALRLKEIVDYALEHEADAVIFAGDAFKTRDPNATLQRAFARQIRRLSSKGVHTVLLAGNHDMPLMETRATSLDIFGVLEVPYVTVALDERVHRLETRRGLLQVATVPWPQRARLLKHEEHRTRSPQELDALLEQIVSQEIARLARELDPNAPAILLAHFSVSGARFGAERSTLLGTDVVFKLSSLHLHAWDYVALGHIHSHQVVNPGQYPAVVYAGSPERVDFSEAEEPKGFCWLEVVKGETHWRFVPLPARAMVAVELDLTNQADPTDAALRALERYNVQDAIVRVRLRIRRDQEPALEIRRIERALHGAGADYIAGVSYEVQAAPRSRLAVERPEQLSPEELLRRYFQIKGEDEQRIDALLALARELMHS